MSNGPQRLNDIELELQVGRKPEYKVREPKPEKPERKSSAYQYALFLLSGQDYSEFKIRQKMKSKEYEAAEIDEAVAKLIEKNYLRENEYKKLLAKKLMRKGKADNLIKRQVGQEKLEINAAELQELREECGVSSEDTLTQLVEKKMRGKTWPTKREERQKLEQKIYRYILSRGFSFDEAEKAMRAYGVVNIDD